jgi:crossover junction endodeoxyribonuclease RuvC
MTLICGVDPGLSGALCFYDPAIGEVEIIDMPTLALGKTAKRRINEHQLANILWKRHVGHAYLELVALRPKESGTSALTIGIGFGIIRGVLAAVGVPFTIVTAKAWKGAIGVTGDKDNSRLRASQLLPHASAQWPLKKHDGRAEAALIALYGANVFLGIATETAARAAELGAMAAAACPIPGLADLPDDDLDRAIDEAAL